jgi:hypothetical protein
MPKESNREARVQRTRELVEVHGIIDDSWVHTQGLAALGLPELEIRGVPNFLYPEAGQLLLHIADYMIHDKAQIQPGQTMRTGPGQYFRFMKGEPPPSNEGKYASETLRLVDISGT